MAILPYTARRAYLESTCPRRTMALLSPNPTRSLAWRRTDISLSCCAWAAALGPAQGASVLLTT